MPSYRPNVTFGTDASAMSAGIGAARSQIAALAPLVQQLNSTFQGMGEQIKTSMSSSAESAKSLNEAMKTLQESVENNAKSLTKAAEAAEKSKTGYEGFKKAFEGIKGAFGMAGDVISAVGAVLKFSQEMGKAASETTHLAERLRTTTGDAQAMQAMATATGVKVDVFAGAMKGLDQTLAGAHKGSKQQSDALREVGLSAGGSQTKTQMLGTALAKLGEMSAGPAKTALAMQLFGKAGSDLLPVLDANKGRFAALTTAIADYGVSNTEAVAKGNELAGSWNTNAIAMQGVNNVLTDALAPILTEVTDSINLLIKAFIQSYNGCGLVAGAFGLFKGVVETVGAVVDALAGIFSALWSAISQVIVGVAGTLLNLFGTDLPQSAGFGAKAINFIKDACVGFKDAVVVIVELVRLAIAALVGFLQASAKTVHDFFSLDWGKIGADWRGGINTLAAEWEAGSKRIEAAMNGIATAREAALNGAALPSTGVHLNFAEPGDKGGKGTTPPKSRATGAPSSQSPQSAAMGALDLQVPSSLPMAIPGGGGEITVYRTQADQEAAIHEQLETKKTEQTRQGETQRAAIEKQAVSAMSSLWSQNIAKLLTLQQGFGTTLKNIYRGMVSMVSDALTKMLENWISAELSKTAAALTGTAARTTAEEGAAAKSLVISAATAIKQIAHSAAVAAAGVYASIAKIPIVGPFLAPAAAVAALYGVIKLGQSIFSAEGGMGTVPYDNSPFLLHKNEMVLPASLATPFRAMLQGGNAANGNMPFAVNDGGAGGAFHYHDHSGTLTPAQIVANRGAVAKALKMAHREGHFASTGLSL